MNIKETTRGIYGAWMLAWFDRNGIHLFENTLEAFWRSFQAAILCAPIYIVLIVMRSMEMEIGVAASAAMIIYAISYVTGWFAFPYAMYHVSRILGREDRFFRYIAAYNWATVLQLSVLLAVAAVTQSGVVPQGFAIILTMAAIFAIFVYKGFIAHVGLEVRPGPATALVLLDFVLALIFESWTLRLLQAVPISSGG